MVKTKKALLVTVESLAEYSIDQYDKQVQCEGEHERVEKGSTGDDSRHNLLQVFTRIGMKISRENKLDQTITYKGTRLIHTIRNKGIEGIMEKRDMSCCCPYCLFGSGECLYPEYADIWSVISVIGSKALKRLKLSEIQNWRNTLTLPVRMVQSNLMNNVPNFDSVSANDKDIDKDTGRVNAKVRRKLDMGSTPKRRIQRNMLNCTNSFYK